MSRFQGQEQCAWPEGSVVFLTFAAPLYREFVPMPVKGMSVVCGPVPVTQTGAGGAYDCFPTERDSLEDLISSFCENRKA